MKLVMNNVITWAAKLSGFHHLNIHDRRHKTLTHLPLNKMAAILRTIFSDAFSWMTFFSFWNKISLKFVSKGPIDNNPALVYIMAWHWLNDKPLSEPMLTRLTDVYAALGGDELTHSEMHKVAAISGCQFSV